MDEEDKIEKTVFVNRPYKDEEIVLKDGKVGDITLTGGVLEMQGGEGAKRRK